MMRGVGLFKIAERIGFVVEKKTFPDLEKVLKSECRVVLTAASDG